MDWESLSRLLEEAHGNPRHGNPDNPEDCLFYLVLSRKTPIATARRIFDRIKASLSTWDDLAGMNESEILRLLYGSGLETIRASQLRKIANILRDRFGSVTLEPLRRWTDAQCLAFLTSLPGVGTKTALCVMMYGLDRQVFPADAHCIRIMKRLGVIQEQLQHRPAQRVLAELVPKHLAYKLHVNMVAHGQKVCRAVKPRCSVCTIAGYCQMYKRILVLPNPALDKR